MTTAAASGDQQTLANVALQRIQGMAEAPLVLGAHRFDSESLIRIARSIAQADPDPHRPIGVFCELSPDGWLVLIAAISSGRPIVPLDPLANHELNRSRIKAAGCSTLISSSPPNAAVQLVDLPFIDLEADCDHPLIQSAADDPCLICFTSGSTGVPKCHARTQAGQWRVGSMRSNFRGFFGADHQILLCMSPAFIGVMNNMAENLVAGGACALLPARAVTPQRLLEEVERFQIRIISLVPTLLRNLLHASKKIGFPESLRGVNVSGEMMTSSDVRDWCRQLPDSLDLYLSYGSTESGTITIHVPREEELQGHGPVPLGVPLPGVDLAIVDEDGRRVAPGEVGALMIRNPAQAIPFPVSDDTPLRSLPDDGDGWFPMGDRGHFTPEQGLVVLGRSDGEVKVDGLRFNPLACESSIRSLAEVEDAALVMVEHRERTRVVAFVVSSPKHLDRIREVARSSGPVGDRVLIELCDELPALLTAKVDRARLRQRALELLDGSTASSHDRQPQTRTEGVIQDVWVNHLKVRAPSIDRTFLELGGTSLAFLTMTLELQNRYGIEFPPDQLANLDTIERMAEAALVVDQDAEGNHPDPLVRFNESSDSSPAVLMLPGLGGHIWAFKPLGETLGDDVLVGGLDWCKCSGVNEMVAAVRAWVGDRPLTLLGFSGGCRVAGKLASALESSGQPPHCLIVLDGPPRDSFVQGVLKNLSARRGRRRGSGSGVDDYLAEFRRQGRLFYAKSIFRRLQTPVVLISTDEATDQLHAKWSRHANVTLHEVPFDHLELVRHPIPAPVTELILSALPR